MKNTVYFNPEWMEALNMLREDVRKDVIEGIISYQISGVVPDVKGARSTFMLLKLEVDRNNRRLAKEREKRNRRKAQKALTATTTPKETPKKEAPKPTQQPPTPKPTTEPVNKPTPEAPKPATNPTPEAPKPAATSPSKPTQEPANKPAQQKPEISPEKKAAIASLLASLMQPRPR